MSVVCLLNIATAPATEPQELVTHPPHLRTLPVSYQSQPVGVDQPQPAGVHQPMPVNNRNLSTITEDGMYVDKVITIMYYN